MKKYLLVHRETEIPEELSALKGTFSEAFSAEEAVRAVEQEETLSAVLIDTPSAIPDIRQLIRISRANENE